MTYTTTAKGLASLGRNGDDTLLHVNRNELAGLQALLGPVSVNPNTGMPEAYSWTSMLGSIVGGLSSFGAGAILEPIVSDAFDSSTNDLLKEITSKALPAAVGAGIGASIGAATGGKGGALGGAVQGFMSGGLGAFGSEDVLGKTDSSQSSFPMESNTGPDSPLYRQAQAQSSPVPYSQTSELDQLLGAKKQYLQSPADAYTGGSSANPMDSVGDNLSQAYSNLSQPGKLKDLANDYGSYLFQAGLIGQGMADNVNANNYAKQQQEDYRRMQQLRNWQAQQQVNKLWAGIPQYYAEGGDVTLSSQGPIPVQVTIPSKDVDEAIEAGGLGNLMGSRSQYATGGYINTQQVNPDAFYPQSQIPKAQPYLAATPIRHEVLSAYSEGGYIDGDGDGQSDDIPADIDGKEEVRVADGEFVIPKHIVDMIGSDRLDELLRQVRRAAYGRDEQIPENAGKIATERLMERYA